MEFSPRRSSLYRNRMFAVTLAASTWLCSPWLVAQGPVIQYGHKPKSNKGPRALGLIQLSPKGDKGRLTPIAIMMDGKFYDAGSYKAAPVPMALDFDIVYEGFRNGVSQGIFTITQPGQLNHVWIAEGTWLPAGAKAPEKGMKYSTPVIEDKDAPPVLHRPRDKADSDSSDSKDGDKNKEKDQQRPATTPAPPAARPPTSPSPPNSAKATAATAKASGSDEPIADPNRPRLRRGKPDLTVRREPSTTSFEALADTAVAQTVVIAAISDAGGPDPRPYTYDVKPAEGTIYRKKMFDLAVTQLHAHASAATKEPAPARNKASTGKPAGKSPTPAFDGVNLRIFDLSNSNEPILVLSAKTHPAGASVGSNDSFEPQEITLVARTNLEGELQKLFFSQTDSRHLDVAPRMELIDAVDADGDGRGELLFRRSFDSGSAYAIYRVTADGLWPLFEGTP